jgi:hypothetical protein
MSLPTSTPVFQSTYRFFGGNLISTKMSPRPGFSLEIGYSFKFVIRDFLFVICHFFGLFFLGLRDKR